MATMAIVGITWGDEGKGRMVDLVSEDFQVVCRYQGGNNAGHTVVNQLGTFKLNLLPSGICRENVINILGNGTVIDLEHLFNEIATLRERGINITPDNFKISDRAHYLPALAQAAGHLRGGAPCRQEIRFHPPRHRSRVRR